jgi:enoyl-[acyl-carrier-protein] reductase (NADH)
VALHALPTIPTPTEIAGAVVFLASDLSRAITGQTLNVNCGRTLD